MSETARSEILDEQEIARCHLLVSQEEIAALCAPLKRPSAQFQKLQSMGFKVWWGAGSRKRVQLSRVAYENWKNPPPPVEVRTEWKPPPRPAWDETPLGRWQKQVRDNSAAIAAEQAAYLASLPKPTRKEVAAQARQLAVAAKEHHAALVRFHVAKRRSKKLQRTPPWSDLDAMRAIYAEARRLSKATGTAHHVDHIIPLQGKTVSGLHVHTNLQILTGSENSKKRNRYEA
ncbi:MAG: HNH endonuclease signature motif containing protein [Pseudomonadota bacterium]